MYETGDEAETSGAGMRRLRNGKSYHLPTVEDNYVSKKVKEHVKTFQGQGFAVSVTANKPGKKIQDKDSENSESDDSQKEDDSYLPKNEKKEVISDPVVVPKNENYALKPAQPESKGRVCYCGIIALVVIVGAVLYGCFMFEISDPPNLVLKEFDTLFKDLDDNFPLKTRSVHLLKSSLVSRLVSICGKSLQDSKLLVFTVCEDGIFSAKVSEFLSNSLQLVYTKCLPVFKETVLNQNQLQDIVSNPKVSSSIPPGLITISDSLENFNAASLSALLTFCDETSDHLGKSFLKLKYGRTGSKEELIQNLRSDLSKVVKDDMVDPLISRIAYFV